MSKPDVVGECLRVAALIPPALHHRFAFRIREQEWRDLLLAMDSALPDAALCVSTNTQTPVTLLAGVPVYIDKGTP